MSNGVKTKLHERLAAFSDDDLRAAMHECHALGLGTVAAPGGVIRKLAEELAPIGQTKPEYLIAIIAQAIIVNAASRFAGLPVDSRRYA
jgi:hypothetical protein